MKKLITILIVVILTTSFVIINKFKGYDPSYVDISSIDFASISYDLLWMKRTGNHVKAKYFGAKGEDGSTVPSRFLRWKNGKDIICVTSAGYMDNYYTPVGLTIDNGRLVNGTLEDFDGLVIVYATGGVVATNLKNADLSVQGGNIPAGLKLDIRNNPLHLQMFIDWAESQQATVFQTHLFVYKNQLDPRTNNDPGKIRERRFLAVGNIGNEVFHTVVNCSKNTTLKVGAQNVLTFLNKYKGMNVTFMINLDPGAQNVFFLMDENGNFNDVIRGTEPIQSAANLLVYYYEN